jgi:pimeloyl-ACP methyl ester carboxylesterase
MADPGALAPLGEPGAPTPYWPGRRWPAGGTTVHVRETPGPAGGDAPTAVYVHGLGGSSNNWTELAQGLSSRSRGLAVDLPGFGRTAPPESGDYRPVAHAAVVEAFVEGLGAPVDLLGNSLGGAVALLVAARRPDLVRTLTLVSPAMPDLRPLPSRVGGRRAVLALLPGLGASARREQALRTPAERLDATMALCHADPGRVGPAALAMAREEAAERAAMAWTPEALQRSFLGLVGTWCAPPGRSLWAAAAAVSAPTLVVWGERDRLVGVGRAARTAAALPAGRLLRLAETGHVAQIERPDVVGRAVLGLWDAAADGRWPAAGVNGPGADHRTDEGAPVGMTRARSPVCGTVPV